MYEIQCAENVATTVGLAIVFGMDSAKASPMTCGGQRKVFTTPP
jgi:hypothetical protein